MGTVTKALSLLGLFTQIRPEIGLSDLTRLSGMNKATTHRLLRELQAQGFVEQVGPERAYRLGPEVLRLAALREATVPILSVSREVLDRLSAATGETAHISLVQGTKLNALGHAYSPRYATRVMMDDTEVLSFHATGSGLAVLAWAEPALIDTVLAEPLHAFTPETETSAPAIRARLDQIRANGMAESIGGYEADVHSYAAPVFGPDQRPIGALAVAAPVSRMTETLKQTIRAELAAGARDMTQRIGGLYPPSFPAARAA
jgi:DNA-binding IclR family transcriptional regulator